MTQNIVTPKQHFLSFQFLPIITYLCLLGSCVQNQNSSSNDRERYQQKTIDTSTPEGLRLSNAYNVIKNNCVSCHSQMDMATNEEWLSSGYLSPGSAISSLIYCRIKGSGCGAEDMPKESAISNSDLTAVKTWIDNL